MRIYTEFSPSLRIHTDLHVMIEGLYAYMGSYPGIRFYTDLGLRIDAYNLWADKMPTVISTTSASGWKQVPEPKEAKNGLARGSEVGRGLVRGLPTDPKGEGKTVEHLIIGKQAPYLRSA